MGPLSHDFPPQDWLEPASRGAQKSTGGGLLGKGVVEITPGRFAPAPPTDLEQSCREHALGRGRSPGR